MFTLMMILVVAWVVTRWIGAGSCGRHDRSLRRARRESLRLDDRSGTDQHLTPGSQSGSGAAPARTIAETPLEKLQREFATGAITVEQYEHEVGKLYGVRGET
jgi:hypothetical protein